jgi:DNA-binding NtrC family response regulator
MVRNQLPKVLICDDDQTLHLALKSALGKEYDMRSAYNGDEAQAILKKNNVDLVLLDMEMRNEQEGLDTIPKILELQPDVTIIFFSGKTGFQFVRNAMKLGAYDYVPKDAGADELRHVFQKALEHKRLLQVTQQSQYEVKRVHNTHPLIGNSAAIQKIKKQIERARVSPAPVIIFGETGTGKEVVARQLRKNLDGILEPFIAVDSGTIQSSVAESVLFGYEKGAFTGADKATRGLFEEANGGVIYFDELGNMPFDIQNKLLRIIQEKEVLRIGSTKPISLEFRVLCATNQNLEEWIQQGKFKEDLYQRLNVLQIHIPPLRERVEDIPLLLEHFAEAHQNGLPRLIFLPETVSCIQRYPFPGNIRELANTVLYLYAMADGPEISPLDLPPKYHTYISGTAGAREADAKKQGATAIENRTNEVAVQVGRNFYGAVENFEKIFLAQEYKFLEGNVSKMAAELGMDRSYLHGKLKNYGIHVAKK